MWRVIWVILWASVAFAESAIEQFNSNNERIFELFASNIDSIDYTTIIATGNAVIISNDMYVIADYIKYDTKAREANISGNVKFYRDGSMYLSAQKAFVRFDEDYALIEPFYMQDSKSGIWISASMAESRDNEYDFKEIVVSGCDIDSPIWRIEGSSGYYNSDSAIASIWNPRIYIKNIPVFYFPYFFISTQNKRTTGLLYPELALSNLEGFTYIQPLFLALQDFWDMTLSPQVRTSRGLGLYGQFRAVDSANKLFLLNAGIFWNNNKYRREYDIAHKIVFGFDFAHNRYDLLSDVLGIQSDGLYLDFKYMNDLDYIKLQSAKNETIENRLQTSKANYFLSEKEHYFGLYFKYFLDLSKLSNSDTFQTLPQVQYHHQLEQTAFKNLMYSVDINSKNISRARGFGYVDNSISVPLYISTPLVAEYLTIGANLNLNAGIISLNKIQTSNKNSSYFGATYGIFANTDVAKQYDKVFHTMSFSANFSSPLYNYYDDRNGIFSTSNDCSFITAENQVRCALAGSISSTSATEQLVELSFSQYFFGLGGLEVLYHRMHQSFYPQNAQSRLGNLRNELGFSPIDNLDISTTIFYSHLYGEIEEASLAAALRVGRFQGDMTYFIKKKFDLSDTREKYSEESANFLRVKMSYDFEYFEVYGDIGYDFRLKYLRDWNVAISKDIRCFGIGLRFANEITPILTTTSNGSINTQTVRNSYVSLEFRFVPVTATSFSYRFKETRESN